MYSNPNSVSRNIALALILLLSFVLSIRQIYGEDIGFHLNAARWMIENHSFPDLDTFTYTANANKYIDLNWLYQLILYAVYALAGSTGLILFNSLLIIGCIIIIFKRVNTSSALLPWLFLLSILTLSTSFELRPHSVSWLMLSITLYLLQEYYQGNKKMIRWLPLVMLFWVNMHSLFILGIAVIGCYGISIYFSKNNLFRKFLIYGGSSIFICLLNPYGWKGFTLPLEQLFTIQAGNIFKENIRELKSPFSITNYDISKVFSTWHFFDLFLIFAVILLLINRKKLKLHEWAIVLLFFYFACSAIKNVGYFVFAVLPVISGFPKEEIKPKRKNTRVPFAEKYRKQISIGFIMVCSLLILSVATNAFYIHYRAIYRFGFGWSNSTLPVKAVDFIQKKNIRGKILNQLDYGGYLEFFTAQKTAIDGRLDVMGSENFSEQILSVKEEQKASLVEKYKPDIIIFSYFLTPDWISYLQKRADWRLVYADETAAIYLRNDFDPSLPAFTENDIMPSLKRYSNEEIDKMVKEGKNPFLLSSFFKPQYYPEGEFNFTVFCMYYGWMNAAKQLTAGAFDRATKDYPELYQNFGTIYFQERNAPMSLFCYEKYLSKVKNPQLEERVKFLRTVH